MADTATATPVVSRRFGLRALREEGMERKLALTFGFMSFLPILIIVWARLTETDIRIALFAIAGCVFIGYFWLARPMFQAILKMNRRVNEITTGQLEGTVEVAEANEIGELARTFNRVTGELRDKIDELEASREQVKRLLARIGSAIMSYEGIDHLLSLIMENTVDALNAQVGSLLLLDGEKHELQVKTAWSKDGQPRQPAATPIKLGEHLAGWVAKEGRTLRQAGGLGALGLAEATGAAPGLVLGVPLRLRDQPMGVVMVFRGDGARPFSDDETSLMENIGSQIAVAIENYRLNLDVERTYIETIMALALAVEAKDAYSAGHSKRVGYYATQIGEVMGVDREMLKLLNPAGTLHDIGKIGIKDEVLLKPSPLTPEEEQLMQQHSVIGEAIIRPIRSLSKVASLVLHHHERYDGSGYPSGLKGEEIPLGSRILSVADTYDAMATDRPYRKRLPADVIKSELRRQAGSQLDPACVEAFLNVLEEKEHRRATAKAPGSDPASPQGA